MSVALIYNSIVINELSTFFICLLPITVFFKTMFSQSIQPFFLEKMGYFSLLKNSLKLHNCQNSLLKIIPRMLPSIFPNGTRCIEAEMQCYFSISVARVDNRKFCWTGLI